MRSQTRLLGPLILAAALASCERSPNLGGTWVPERLDVAALEREPTGQRVLQIDAAGSGWRGRLIAPTAAGFPIAVQLLEPGRLRLTLQMARGMETPMAATFAGDRITIQPEEEPGGRPQPVVFRRATSAEAAALARLAPARLPLPVPRPMPDNGLVRTPPMGWSSWNKFQTQIDDRTIREIADALVSTGMRDAGYVHVNIDDGWQGARDASGVLQPNPRFPDMKVLADYVHGLGLKLGIYTSPGPKSCANFAGSYGYEDQDARTFAAWGMDYVKYDWCSAGLIYDDSDMPAVYQKMAQALRATSRPMIFSICQYGRADVWRWGAAAGGNLWRTTGDIADRWEILSAIGLSQDELAPHAGPGHWNDPDMLEVGNGGMTTTEYRTHVSLWALLAAPLIAGHDVRRSTPETTALLTNPEMIAIDQDSLGRQGRRVTSHGPTEVWSRPLSNSRLAVGLFNLGDAPARIEVKLSELGQGGEVAVRDVWQRLDLGKTGDAIGLPVLAHDVALLVLTPSNNL